MTFEAAEQLALDIFFGRGGHFAIDEDGDLHAIVDGERRGLYGPRYQVAVAPLFTDNRVPKILRLVMVRALVRAAHEAKRTGNVRRIRLYAEETLGRPVYADERRPR